MILTAAPSDERFRGGMRVADLLVTSSLGLELIAGDAGTQRVISWMHTSEVDDPGAWLDGGELLFTLGLGLPKDASGQVDYVERLDAHGLAALAIGEGIRHPPLTAEMLSRADELGFPIMMVPREVPIIAVSHLVAASTQDIARRRLAVHVSIFETLRDHPLTSSHDAKLFARLEEISGYRLYLVSKSGKPLMAGLRKPPPELVEHLQTVEGEDVAIPRGRVVPVPAGSRTAGYLIAVELDDRVSFGLSAIRHVSTVAALRMAEVYRIRELERRKGSEHFMNLLAGRLSGPEADNLLITAGLSSAQDLVLAACSEMDGQIDAELHHRLLDADVQHLMLRQGELYLLLPNTVEALAVLESEPAIAVGLSRALIGSVANLPLARREALWSLQRALPPSTSRVVRFGENSDYAHWLPADFAALEGMVHSILGPVIAYDEEHKTELLATLASSFRHQRKLLVTSEELFIHKHTLAYRLTRINDLTGRDLNEVADQAQLWLALKALAVIDPGRLEADPRLRI